MGEVVKLTRRVRITLERQVRKRMSKAQREREHTCMEISRENSATFVSGGRWPVGTQGVAGGREVGKSPIRLESPGPLTSAPAERSQSGIRPWPYPATLAETEGWFPPHSLPYNSGNSASCMASLDGVTIRATILSYS